MVSGSLALSPASTPLHDLGWVAPAPWAFLLSSEHPLPLQGSVRMEKKAVTCCFSFFQTLCCSELPAWRHFHIRELNPRRLYRWVGFVQVQAVSRERGQPTGPGGGFQALRLQGTLPNNLCLRPGPCACLMWMKETPCSARETDRGTEGRRDRLAPPTAPSMPAPSVSEGDLTTPSLLILPLR